MEGLDDLLFYVLPEEREAVLQHLRELMVLRLSQNPRWRKAKSRHMGGFFISFPLASRPM